MVRKLFQKRINDIIERFSDVHVQLNSRNANFFGQKSRGRRQIRGNGVLLLTDDNLYFEMWTPKKNLQIPLSSIYKIETPKKFLSKSVFKPLLKVTFNNENGEEDSAAWYLKDLDSWLDALKELNRTF